MNEPRPMGTPRPCANQTRPTSAATVAITIRPRDDRGLLPLLTVVACTGEPHDAADEEATNGPRGVGSDRRADRRAPTLGPAPDQPGHRSEDARRPHNDRGPEAPRADRAAGIPQLRSVARAAHPRRVRRW